MAESDELDQLLLPAAIRLDALRAGGLRGQLGIAVAQDAALEREEARLARKLGKDDPRLQALALRREQGQAQRRELAVEITRAETVPPTVGKGEWAIHGFVLQQDLSPARDLTVSLADAQGQWLRALGHACTDARGAFRLVAKAATDPAGTPAGAYLRVSDASRKELYRSEEAVAVKAGTAVYREVVLGDDRGRCASPDETVPTCGPQPPAPAPAPTPGPPPTPGPAPTPASAPMPGPREAAPKKRRRGPS